MRMIGFHTLTVMLLLAVFALAGCSDGSSGANPKVIATKENLHQSINQRVIIEGRPVVTITGWQIHGRYETVYLATGLPDEYASRDRVRVEGVLRYTPKRIGRTTNDLGQSIATDERDGELIPEQFTLTGERVVE